MLDHSESCQGVGKIKARALVRSNVFCSQVTGPGVELSSSATGDRLAKIAQSVGMGGVQLSNAVLYAAKRAVESSNDDLYKEKFEALPTYLADLVEANPGSSYRVLTDQNSGEFQMAFLHLEPAAELLRLQVRYMRSV